ncbi:hypothetical protein P9112_000814 [Eukaryota sp. TZLM1-RC]
MQTRSSDASVRLSSLKDLVRLYPKIALKSLLVALPLLSYVAFTLLSRVSLFCSPQARTMNDRFWLAAENMFQNTLVLTFFYWPIYFLWPRKTVGFRKYTIGFGLAIALYSMLKPFTLGDRVPAAYLLAGLYGCEFIFLFRISKYCKKREIIRPRYFLFMFLPFIVNLFLMEFVIIRMYFAAESYATRVFIRMVLAPFLCYTSETFARIAIRRICTHYQQNQKKCDVSVIMKSMRKPFAFLFGIHSVVKLLVLRLLVANAGSLIETTFMVVIAAILEIFWKYTARARDEWIEKTLVTKKGGATIVDVDDVEMQASGLFEKQNEVYEEVSSPAPIHTQENILDEQLPVPNEVISDGTSPSDVTSPPVEKSHLNQEEPSTDEESQDDDEESVLLSEVQNLAGNESGTDTDVKSIEMRGICESPVKKASKTDIQTFKDENLTDFDLLYANINLFDIVFDLTAIVITFAMSMCAYILFESWDALYEALPELLSVLVVQCGTNFLTDITVLYCLSLKRMKQREKTHFPLVWERYAKQYYLPLFIPMATGIVYYCVRYYLAIRQTWHNFSFSDDVVNEACRHARFGPFSE